MAPMIGISSMTLMLLLLMGSQYSAEAAGRRTPAPVIIKYYAYQRFGENELGMVAAARPAVKGTLAGFGTEVVYEYSVFTKPNTKSKFLGFIRGTSVVVNNTRTSNTFVVNNVIHYDDGKKLKGSIVQQGEAAFDSGKPWQFAVVGGTGSFANVYGYNTGRVYSMKTSSSGQRTVFTEYKLRLWYR